MHLNDLALERSVFPEDQTFASFNTRVEVALAASNDERNEAMAFDSMKAIPVDQAAMDLVALEVNPSNDMDGEQKADRDGVPYWLIACYGKNPITGGLQTVEVRIAADKAPAVKGPVVFKSLVARPWVIADGGRNGITVSAEDVAVRGQQPTTAPAPR